MLPGKIGKLKKKFRFLIDTGSSVSIIDRKVYQSASKDDKTEELPDPYRLFTASGDPLQTHGMIRVELKVGSSVAEQEFILADLGNCEGILGVDFLDRNNCHLNFSSGVLKIKGKSVALAKEVNQICARLKTETSTVIPPRSEAFVWTRFHQEDQEDRITEVEGLVEGVGDFRQGGKMAVPRCLLIAEKNRVQVPVTNFSNEEKIIGPGVELASMEGALTLSSTTQSGSERGEEEENDTELPEHLEEMMKRASPNIKAETRAGLRRVLKELQDCFACPGGKLGRNGRCKHKINVQGHYPRKSQPRRYPLAQRDIVEAELQKMLDNDIIEPSSSPWASNVVLVKKKDNSVRFCVDYRRLNEVTKKDAYPLPHIGDTLDALSGNKWFSCLDMSAGFNQVEMDPFSKEYTAFNTHKGLYQYKVLPFGLCNSPPTFQRLMELVLNGLLFDRCLVYIDDVVVMGKTEEEALENLRMVLLRFKEANLKLKPSKCFLFQEQCTFLGHTVNADGTTCEKQKVEAVQSWPEPRNVTEVRSFLGTCSYYRKFIPNFAEIAAPLTNLTRKFQKFEWSSSCQKAFDTLKKSLTTAPILSYPSSEGQFILDTDASGTAIGAVLSQVQGGEEKVLSYASAILPKEKQNYCTTYRELYAVVKFVKYFSHYLWGRHFLVRTDHGSLRWLQNFKNPEGVVARWLATLGTYDFEIEHRRGAQHGNADGLSRIPRKKCFREECQECKAALAVRCLCTTNQKVLVVEKEIDKNLETHPSKEDNPILAEGAKNQETTQNKETHPRKEDFSTLAEGANTQSSNQTLATNTRSQKNSDTKDERTQVTEEADGREVPQTSAEPPIPDWLDPWDKSDLLKKQQDDPVTSEVLKMMAREKPDPSQTALFSSSIRTLVRRWEDLEVIDRLLYIKVKDPVTNSNVPRLVAPEGVRTRIMKSLHDGRTSGHLGRRRTIERVKQHVYWPGMAEDIASWVRQCDLCARRKPGPGKAKYPMGHKNVGLPFERVAIDIMGPLPQSHDGYSYIMVVECYYSKWVEAYSLADHTAQTVGDQLLCQWICRFGVPTTIHTDQGPEFESRLFHHLCQELGSLKTRTTPYHPQSDGMVERQNRTIQQMLACYVNDCYDDWSDHLDYVMMAYRSSLHESTGCTPNRVIFGREVNLPLTVQLGEQHSCEGAECPIEYVQWVKNTLEKVFSFVRQKSKKSTAKQKAHHDRHCKIREVTEGSMVWRWYPPKGKQKLGLGWTGPYRVLELIGKHAAKIKSHDRELTVHLNDLKPYEGREYLIDSESDQEADDKEEAEASRLSTDESSSENEDEEEEAATDPIPNYESSSQSENEVEDEPVKKSRRGRKIQLPARYRSY